MENVFKIIYDKTKAKKIIGINDIVLPFFVASFQLIFLNCGNLVANSIAKYVNVSEYALSISSSIILILVGIFRAI